MTVSSSVDLHSLIDKYERHRPHYRSGQYNETQLRVEFVDQLFIALGWDVRNDAGYADAYKDVIHEDAIKIGTATKAPDYAFRVGGVRKFFLETKKPSVDITRDPEPAWQLRRYAWSAKLPLSILTNFEHLAVYDTRVRPNQSDPASTARVMLIHYTELIDRWDELRNIFSLESIRLGSFDQYAESNRTKRGTAEVDDAFLADLEHWRDMLARNIALRNSVTNVGADDPVGPNPGRSRSLTQRELNYAVQMTIDRIIFLRICEDRGIEQYGRLQALANGSGIYARLQDLYRQADERYNSGLFHFRPERDRSGEPDQLTTSLEIDDKVLRDIFKHLYYPHSPYEFSALPADILGQIYERFLGSVIRLTPGGQAKVEEKPEVRKAGGVYYTPTYIVDYIVEQTVGKLVEGKTPKQVENLKILDPACGSGSFLIGAYQYLLDWHRDYYVGDGADRHAKVIYQGQGGEWRLTTAERRRILLNNIYGVDIDQQAVEVTKLSLLLKVLEGETEESLGRQLQFVYKERALPDLRDNIKCGNSLIGPDFYQTVQLGLAGFDEEERYRINVFDWEAEFPQIMRGKNRGFDAVIGNPPYIRIQRIPHEHADYLFQKYETPTSKTDISQVFIERAIDLLNTHGLVGFISTSQWMYTDYGRLMRKYLGSGLLIRLVDFGSLPVFSGADTYPAIHIIGRKQQNALELIKVTEKAQLNPLGLKEAPELQIPFSTLDEKPWNLGNLHLAEILARGDKPWVKFSEIGHAYIGLLTGMDRVFVLSSEQADRLDLERELLVPYANRGAEVHRYSDVWPKSLVVVPYQAADDGSLQLIPENELRVQYPAIHSYLESHKRELRTRKDSRKLYATGSDWYRHLRAGTATHIDNEKLLVKGIGNHFEVGILAEGAAFSGANCPGIIIENEDKHSRNYILGVLNSGLISLHLRSVSPSKLGNYTRFNSRSINALPFRSIDFDDPADLERHGRMVSLVQQMLDLHEQRDAARTDQDKQHLDRLIAATDNQIDQLVYDLYDLTDEEIAIVEGEVG